MTSKINHFHPNSRVISTYGHRSLTLDSGLRRNFLWIFASANLSSIIGIDFLAHLTVFLDVRNKILFDATTSLTITCNEAKD